MRKEKKTRSLAFLWRAPAEEKRRAASQRNSHTGDKSSFIEIIFLQKVSAFSQFLVEMMHLTHVRRLL